MLSRVFAKLAWSGVVVGALLSPFLHPVGTYVIVSISCTWLVYRGLTTNRLLTLVVGAVFFEAIYGFPVGVISMSLLAVGGLVRVMQRFIHVDAWALQGGWSPGAAAMNVAVAYVIYELTLLGSIVSDRVLYGPSMFGLYFSGACTSDVLWVFLVSSSCSLLAMRWSDIPFRRMISYGI